ncbi:class I SAM-dependent methyltransferase [Nocardia sp. NPDC057227]|uniref:class I SAM-dependent methyltransferase n=1 Tax=Nocardia sp. NPDC057227 TaxID=3346056 RepID=UPI00363B0E5B
MTAAPDHTAVRTALWRALPLAHDPAPHVFEDPIGLRLAAPADDWQRRPDMDPATTAPMRASIVARARFVEELLAERAVDQYVVLGAGLDTLAQRNPWPERDLTIYEVDRPGPQEWKRRRLGELGYGVPQRLRPVPVDFETDSWWERLRSAGFEPDRPGHVSPAESEQILVAAT